MDSRVRQLLLTGGVATALGVSGALLSITKSEEGLRYTSYQDGIGVWTICWGHTKGVRPGQTATLDQCKRWFDEDMSKSQAAVRRHVTAPLPQHQLDAYADFVFNVGETKFGRSSMVRLANQHRYAEACNAILLYKYAGKVDCSRPGNRVCPGVWRRRLKEHRLCTTGVFQ